MFIASNSRDGNGGAVSVLATYLESTAPTLANNNTLKLAAVPVAPAAEYSGGAYTIYATVALPGNSMVRQAGRRAPPESSPRPSSFDLGQPIFRAHVRVAKYVGAKRPGVACSPCFAPADCPHPPDGAHASLAWSRTT